MYIVNLVPQLQQSRRYANILRADLLGSAEKTRPSNDVHRLRKVPQRVEGEPCSMLHGLCLPSLPTPRCAPSLSPSFFPFDFTS